jgi:hypothetical protein
MWSIWSLLVVAVGVAVMVVVAAVLVDYWLVLLVSLLAHNCG